MKTSKLFTDVDTCIVDEDTIKKKTNTITMIYGSLLNLLFSVQIYIL